MRLTITGHSMEPTLREGDRVWASFFLRKPRKDDIVIFRHPHQPETLLVKRIAGDLGNGRYKMKGDNPNDSLRVEPISHEEILAKVYLRYYPKSTKHRL